MQPSTSQQALSELQSFQSSRRKPQDILKERETNLGVPTSQQRLVGLRGAISNTENVLKGVDPSVSGRTQGSLVTEAQKQRLISMEREPIASQLSDQNRTLENENANYNELSRRALQDAQLQISSDDQRQNSLQSAYGLLYQREQDAQAKAERDAAARKAAADQARYLSLLGGASGGGGQTAAPVSQSNQDQAIAYQDVQKRLKGDAKSIMSDYMATLKSANFGNIKDKYKIQLYHQQRPDLFGGGGSLGSTVRTIAEADNFKYGKLANPTERASFIASLAR